MPIGRIACLIGQFIRGKHKPGYTRNKYSNPDKCIVVGMNDPLMTGNKRTQKVYRHHTGYSGGLKEIMFKDMLEKKPEQILIRAILGMLPKNDLRHDIIK
jgi:large subunit ribosomal protein L13